MYVKYKSMAETHAVQKITAGDLDPNYLKHRFNILANFVCIKYVVIREQIAV